MYLKYLDAEHLMARSGNSVTLTEMTLGRVLWVDLGILLTSMTTGERVAKASKVPVICVYQLTIVLCLTIRRNVDWWQPQREITTFGDVNNRR